jgi:hypothetical protein
LTPAQIAADVTVISDGETSAIVTYLGNPVVFIEGVTPAQLADQSLWLGNLTP